ncbi:hypothetical protein yc1106_06280 [Curvularia clavata]|uniref:Rhodopsin domain-containing protein n=1 Tax=Curvularia clavata TaxID=95742 RepID=A0A9Q8ZB66_CURCL|nr:hypothetical protein yc1106_06280 [Curvularia clavata]
MSTTPAGQPTVDPKWAAENNLTRVLVLTGIFHISALISVGLRLFVRLGLLRSLGKDDVVIVLAALGALGGWICFILQGYHGFGRHIQTVSKQDMEKFGQIGFFGSIISAIGALGLLKISIALFLLRLKNNNIWKWYSRCLWGLIGLVTFYTIGAWLTFFLHCTPMSANWTRRGVCYSQKMFVAFALTNTCNSPSPKTTLYAVRSHATALNIFTDVCFATLPIPIIWSLQMSRMTRINLIGVLSLGYMYNTSISVLSKPAKQDDSAVALGIVKASYQVKKDPDRTFAQHLNVFGFLQLNVGIIAACIPTLKPLLRSHSRQTQTPRRSAYADIEHAATIGSARQFKSGSRRDGYRDTNGTDGTKKGGMITTTTTTVDETYEMVGRTGGNGTLQDYGVGGQIWHGDVGERRTEGGGGDKREILCTTEVVIDREVRRKIQHDR